MRVLVTGASGHIGGAIATYLSGRGYEVIGLSRRACAPAGLKGWLSADLGAGGLLESIPSTLEPCAAIVHAAAALHNRPDSSELTLVNGFGTQQLLALARAWATSRFVYLSSVPVIGRPRFHPITEEHPTNPRTVYHASKLYGEYLVGLDPTPRTTQVSLRIPSPVGPGTPPQRIAAAFARQARAGAALELAGAGRREQNYVDVRDVARAVELTLTHAARGVFQLAGTTVANLELARLCVRVFGSASNIRFTGTPDREEEDVWDVSAKKAADQFGYRPSVPLEESIRAMGMEEGGGERPPVQQSAA